MATCKAYLLWFKSFDSLLRILIGFTNLYWFLSANNHQRFASRGYNLRSKESLPIYTPQYLVKKSLVGKPPCAPHDRIRRIRGSYLKSFQVLRGLLGQDLQHSTSTVLTVSLQGWLEASRELCNSSLPQQSLQRFSEQSVLTPLCRFTVKYIWPRATRCNQWNH